MKTIYKYLIIADFSAPSKTVVMLLFSMLVFENAFGQLNSSNVSPKDEFVIASFGINKMVFNNQAFDAWTLANYNLKEKNSITGFLDVDVIIRTRFDAGAYLSFNSGYALSTIYLGGRLTGPHSSISSWLHLEIGAVSGFFANLAPSDYQLPPEGQGKKTELQYHAGYVGILSKNYLNFLHGNIRLGKTRIPINGGFYAGIGFTPFSRNWKYGYYENDSTFVGQPVHSIPKLSKTYLKTGIFVGF